VCPYFVPVVGYSAVSSAIAGQDNVPERLSRVNFGPRLGVSVSGWQVCPTGTTDPATRLRRPTRALLEVLINGKGASAFPDAPFDDLIPSQDVLERDLRDGI
jgi:hypothetical protein